MEEINLGESIRSTFSGIARVNLLVSDEDLRRFKLSRQEIASCLDTLAHFKNMADRLGFLNEE